MIDTQLTGHWIRRNKDQIDDEIVFIDSFGRFISKIPDNKKMAIVGGWQRFWIRLEDNCSHRYGVSMTPDFQRPWNLFITVTNEQMKIEREHGINFLYEKMEPDGVSEKYLNLELIIIKKMILLESLV